MKNINVDSDYLKNKINYGNYPKVLIKNVGLVSARTLNLGEKVRVHFYSDTEEVQNKTIENLLNSQVLLTKNINGAEYCSIIPSIKFHKKYSKIHEKEQSDNLYLPIVGSNFAYEVNETITFKNIFRQVVKLCSGDFICPYDSEHSLHYSIYKYNLQDEYA